MRCGDARGTVEIFDLICQADADPDSESILDERLHLAHLHSVGGFDLGLKPFRRCRGR
jgi:hypothetical protein